MPKHSKLRNKKKDKKKNTYNRYGKYTSKHLRIIAEMKKKPSSKKKTSLTKVRTLLSINCFE